MDYTAIVIAAGLSSRMGEFKPLLNIGGKPALIRLLDTIHSAGIEKIIVVTGHESELIEEVVNKTEGDGEHSGDGSLCVRARTQREPSPLCSPSPSVLFNADYESGMFSSVQAGIRRAEGSDAALLFPADVPLVTADTIRGLTAAYEQSDPSRFAVPVFEGKNGHPLLIPQKCYDEILGYTGEGGLKGVRGKYDAEMLKWTVTDRGCVLDMDTPDDYEQILEYYKMRNKFEPSSTRVFLVRHGKSARHESPIYLGQHDVPLSDHGRHEAAKAAEKFVKRGARPKRIYSSDLCRASETAEIIAERLGGVPVILDKLFREMSMGSWDGELIEDIKKKFPGEYEKRGDDIRNYRTPGGENFYDLHGRVTREFHRIFAEDFRDLEEPGDLVIVAHLGVVSSLYEELTGEGNATGYWPHFKTGSVTVLDTPDWLWGDR